MLSKLGRAGRSETVPETTWVAGISLARCRCARVADSCLSGSRHTHSSAPPLRYAVLLPSPAPTSKTRLPRYGRTWDDQYRFQFLAFSKSGSSPPSYSYSEAVIRLLRRYGRERSSGAPG